MNPNMEKYISAGMALATQCSIAWELLPNDDGSIARDVSWSLHRLCGTPSPPSFYLSDLGTDRRCMEVLNSRDPEFYEVEPTKRALSPLWQDFIKAAVLDQIKNRSSKPATVLLTIVRPLKVLATCAPDCEPTDLKLEHVEFAIDIAKEIQPSHRLAVLVEAVVRNVIDLNFLTDISPLLTFSSLRAPIGSLVKPSKDVRKNLTERSNVEKLPDAEAFWELVRIVFTEDPRSFVDELRFAQIKILILCGLRISEVCTLPLDWKRHQGYVDISGEPAGNLGGISKSMILRYFAEKKSLTDRHGVLLYPEQQHIPELFEETIDKTLTRIIELTQPMRERLKFQVATGRIFAEYRLDQLVSVLELYPYMTGNPFVYIDPLEKELVDKYKYKFNLDCLEEIDIRQKNLGARGADIRNEVRVYFSRLRRGKNDALPFRSANGHKLVRSDYRNGYFLIEELEKFISIDMPSKVSDTGKFRTSLNDIDSFEFLFLNPKRSLIDERNGGVCDIRKFCFIGRVTSEDLMKNIGPDPEKNSTLFYRYGKTDLDKKNFTQTHSFRHLQNTELFRLGIADTIITKRFGRKSIAQSYVYDHRSLLEDLDSVEVPEAASQILGPKAMQVFKMISAEKIGGKIVTEFLRIQKTEGDDEAFKYLAAEADGFHATPFGFCINSFTVDPCPNHLECYNGCRHLSSPVIPEHRTNLESLRAKLRETVVTIEGRSSTSIGYANQLAHARVRLKNIGIAIAVQPGTRPFPDGEDLSVPISTCKKSVVDV